MFNKVLIANRGEIAVRIIKTCKLLGIHTIAVYSDADFESLHVQLADEAHLIGGPRVTESYLNMDKLFDVAVKTKAEAIHPGYGLLSENPKFASRCQDEGIVFIGPSPQVISQMGNKIEARKAMKEAGLPVVDGILNPLANREEARSFANNIGYPVMLKASAGGGGIGMQIIRKEDEILKAYDGNQKRAKSLFDNGTMYLEKYIENPRHIEIQILADHFGNVVHLWERECSIQRRHQKIVEEAPSVFLDEGTRQKMVNAAVLAAKSIGYTNAGTIEFLVDSNKQFYFLEMNTRLQVEHPITEEITGMDLVKEQLCIAAGEKLTRSQQQIKREGHAIEVRIYAEDPVTFFPSPGTITKLVLPIDQGVRHELGIGEQSIVSPYYDPMIAKMIVKGNDRNEAITRLQTALATYKIDGIKTNIPLLQKTVSHPAFLSGDTTTEFLTKHRLFSQ